MHRAYALSNAQSSERACAPSMCTYVTDVRTNEEFPSPILDPPPLSTRGRAYENFPDPVSSQTRTCVDCGGPRSPHAHARCRACYKAHAIATAKTWHCPECGQPMSERKSTRCLECRRAAVADAKAAFVEDVEWLLEAGTAPADVLARLGTNANAAARRLYRYKRGDLAAVFEHLRGRRRAA